MNEQSTDIVHFFSGKLANPDVSKFESIRKVLDEAYTRPMKEIKAKLDGVKLKPNQTIGWNMVAVERMVEDIVFSFDTYLDTITLAKEFNEKIVENYQRLIDMQKHMQVCFGLVSSPGVFGNYLLGNLHASSIVEMTDCVVMPRMTYSKYIIGDKYLPLLITNSDHYILTRYALFVMATDTINAVQSLLPSKIIESMATPGGLPPLTVFQHLVDLTKSTSQVGYKFIRVRQNETADRLVILFKQLSEVYQKEGTAFSSDLYLQKVLKDIENLRADFKAYVMSKVVKHYDSGTFLPHLVL